MATASWLTFRSTLADDSSQCRPRLRGWPITCGDPTTYPTRWPASIGYASLPSFSGSPSHRPGMSSRKTWHQLNLCLLKKHLLMMALPDYLRTTLYQLTVSGGPITAVPLLGPPKNCLIDWANSLRAECVKFQSLSQGEPFWILVKHGGSVWYMCATV